MNLGLEYKKMKRTGFYPAFFAGGILASCFPLLNMLVRPKSFTSLPQTPLQILFGANWQMMAMLNTLLILAGACILYHTEYADNACLRMQTLPVWENSSFFDKFFLMGGTCGIALFIEGAALLFCALHWFDSYSGFWEELAKNLGYSLILLLPCMLLSLLIASTFQNMWVSLGAGVLCIFFASMTTFTRHFILQVFPFSLPFQIYTDSKDNLPFLKAAAIEILCITAIQLILSKIRRYHA